MEEIRWEGTGVGWWPGEPSICHPLLSLSGTPSGHRSHPKTWTFPFTPWYPAPWHLAELRIALACGLWGCLVREAGALSPSYGASSPGAGCLPLWVSSCEQGTFLCL